MKLKEVIDFKNGKKRPKSEGNIPVYGGYRNCYTSNFEKSIVIATFNSKNVVNVNHLSTKILCG